MTADEAASPSAGITEPPSIVADVRRAFELIVPTALAFGAENWPTCTGIAFIGHQRTPLPPEQLDAELSAAALSGAYCSMCAMAPALGLLSALRTLCPQAVGAERHDLVALAVQRAFGWLLLALPAVAVLMCSAKRILLFVGQPPEVVVLAAPFCMALMPEYVLEGTMCLFQRVFLAYGHATTNLVVSVAAGVAVAPLAQFMLVRALGYMGVAWAVSVYSLAYLVFQLPAIWRHGLWGHVFAPQPVATLTSCVGAREYAALALPGLVTVLLDYFVRQSVYLLAGLLDEPVVSLGAAGVTSSLYGLALMLWQGASLAASTTVGKAVGAGDSAGAVRAALGAMIATTSLALLTFVGLVAGRHALSGLFTSSVRIATLSARTMPMLGAAIAACALSNVLGGVCAGLGAQRVSAYASLICNLLVGIPVGAWLAFSVLGGSANGIIGLWAGIALAFASSTLMQLAWLIVQARSGANGRARASWWTIIPMLAPTFFVPSTGTSRLLATSEMDEGVHHRHAGNQQMGTAKPSSDVADRPAGSSSALGLL